MKVYIVSKYLTSGYETIIVKVFFTQQKADAWVEQQDIPGIYEIAECDVE